MTTIERFIAVILQCLGFVYALKPRFVVHSLISILCAINSTSVAKTTEKSCFDSCQPPWRHFAAGIIFRSSTLPRIKDTDDDDVDSNEWGKKSDN